MIFCISVFLYTKPQERKSILKKKSFFDAAIETCMTLLYTKLAQYHLRNFQNELLIAFRFSSALFVQNEAQKISVVLSSRCSARFSKKRSEGGLKVYFLPSEALESLIPLYLDSNPLTIEVYRRWPTS